MAVKRMDNVGIVVEDLDAAISFFLELGLLLEGRMPIEGDWAGRVTGVRDQRVEIAILRTPDGHSRIELSRFDTPAIASDHRRAPVNALGYLRVMFAVDDLDDTLARLRPLGATVVNEVVNYENIYRLCYIRGPEGILIGLAQQLGQPTPGRIPWCGRVEDLPYWLLTIRCPVRVGYATHHRIGMPGYEHNEQPPARSQSPAMGRGGRGVGQGCRRPRLMAAMPHRA